MKLSAKRTRVRFSIFDIISSWMASQIFFLLLTMIDQDGLVWRSCLKLYQQKFFKKTHKNNQANIFQSLFFLKMNKKHAKNSRFFI